jgi:hypothetical protein
MLEPGIIPSKLLKMIVTIPVDAVEGLIEEIML